MTENAPDPTDVEVVSEFGNSYIVEHDDGSRDTVPKTREYVLLFEHDLKSLLSGGVGDPITLGNEPDVKVAPTASDRVYTLWVGDGPPVQNPPSETDEVLDGILEAAEFDSTDVLEHLYEEYRNAQVRRDVVERVQQTYAPIPPASVQFDDEGWIIEDTFLLTWRGNVYLITRDFHEQSFVIQGGVEAAQDDVEFLALAPGKEIEEYQIPLPDEDVELMEEEIVFFWKAYWLTHHREQYDDELFWQQIYDYVQSERLREFEARG